MNYIECSCITQDETISEVVVIYLAEVGFESFVTTDDGFKAYIQESLYTQEVKDKIAELQNDFFFNFNSQLIQDKNWNQEWETNFQPINVDNKCYVRASFHKAVPEILYDIVINPKMSFGTGHHETTCLVISELLRINLKDKTVCDMGCGTSVLAILASKMGAASVFAVDIDDWAIENSLENIDTNNIANVVVKKGGAQLLAGQTFHVILANINKNILLMDLDKYVQSINKEGVLIISGFFDIDITILKSKAESLGMKIKNEAVKNKWAMLSFIKTA